MRTPIKTPPWFITSVWKSDLSNLIDLLLWIPYHLQNSVLFWIIAKSPDKPDEINVFVCQPPNIYQALFPLFTVNQRAPGVILFLVKHLRVSCNVFNLK